MIDKIVALFATHEKDNHDLAVELIKGQGISLVDVFKYTPMFVSKESQIMYNPIYVSEGNIVGEDSIYKELPPNFIDDIASWASNQKRILKANEVNRWVLSYLKQI